MKTLPIYLKQVSNPALHGYLSENDLQMRFSALHILYYGIARPLMPLFVRHWLQNRYVRGVKCRPAFIWADLVELLKSDQKVWERFTKSLYPEGCGTSTILTHDVETQKGYDFIPKIIELEQAYGFRSSWNLVPFKYKLHPDIVELITESGNEIGIHGYNHDGTLYYSKARFLQRAVYINQALKKYGAVGFRSPQVHRNLSWLQHLDILYDASCFDYDPYQPFPGGTGSIWPFMAGKLVELPYTLPQDHVLFYMLNKRNIDIWKRKVDWLVKNRGMILSITHPDYLVERNHLDLYKELLAYLKEIKNSWHCLPREMAKWYKNLPEVGKEHTEVRQ
jgi:peptidoglycan/xylan/chitin deacetylase (PgdA/CDA1 family)